MPTTGPEAAVELGPLGLDRGAHLLIDQALGPLPPGAGVEVRGSDPSLAADLAGWARRHGHRVEGRVVVRGEAVDQRWCGAERSGDPSPGVVAERAPASWGLAARGALVEAGGPALPGADLDERPLVWSELAPQLYAQAAASQWDPATAVDWDAAVVLPEVVERSVVQVMTYLVENEQAALVVPSHFVGRIHPHYREIVQLLAIQMADEARHIEVFSRRAALSGSALGASAVTGRASLQTLLDERDFSVAEFLLAVLGEGTFLHLLAFLERHAPDPLTARLCHLALQDEARHVAFGMAHLDEALQADQDLRARLAAAVVERHRVLEHTAGLAEGVHDALVVLAAGSLDPQAVGRGSDLVAALQGDMDAGRRRRLVKLGFTDGEAAELSSLHTANFM